jgi:hypothetical protein
MVYNNMFVSGTELADYPFEFIVCDEATVS